MTDLLTETIVEPTLDGDHERFCHIVVEGVRPAGSDADYTPIGNSVVDAAVFGNTVWALCGKRWVPNLNTQKYPLCPTCKDIADSRGWKVPR